MARGLPAPPSVSAAVAQFMLGSIAAITVIMVGGFFALRSVAITEATHDTTERVRAEARLVEVAGLDDGILRSDPRTIQRLDDLVRTRVLSDSIVRVKIWKEDGTILYSDEHAEMYQRFSSIGASGTRILRTLVPPLIAGMVVLLLFQVPLAWTLARRLQRGSAEREGLLANAIAASTHERQPLRQGVRELRTLLLEIHPPNLEAAGLRVALSDLLSPLEAQGISTTLDVDTETGKREGDRPTNQAARDALVYRVAREAIRNAERHAKPLSVTVARGEEGHVGLTLLTDVVAQANGALTVRSTPGTGTTLTLELPAS